MSKQTINIGASPNDGTGTPLRTSFDYTNQNFTEIYTALGGGVALPGATTQVIFNDGGTNLAGDAGLVYNKTTDALTVAGLVTAGSTTITGDLTVDTNVLKVDTTNDRVGIGTTNTFKPLTVQAGSTGSAAINQGLVINSSAAYGVGQGVSYSSLVFSRNRSVDTTSLTASAEIFGGNAVETSSDGGFLGFRTQNAAGTLTNRYTIDNTGISTWSVAGTTAMTLNSTGLGIGIASPRVKLDVNGGLLVNNYDTSSNYAPLSVKTTSGITTPSTFTNAINIWNTTAVGDYSNITFGYNALGLTNAPAYIGFVSTSSASGGFGDLVFGTRSVGTDTAATERVRIDASGNLLVGTTSLGTTDSNSWLVYKQNFGINYFNHATGVITGTAYAFFGYAGVQIGSITQNGTTGVLYNTTSDYRLKESVKPLNGGLARVNALKPSVYNWKSDGSTGEGFLAHELAEVVPAAVSGEKDAMNADGSIKSQGIDMSRVVPILVAAIKELTAEVNALKNA